MPKKKGGHLTMADRETTEDMLNRGRKIPELALYQRPGDAACAVPRLDSYEFRFGRLPATLVVDAGYGSEGNYGWLRAEDVEASVKYGNYHRKQRPKFKKNPTKPKNWSHGVRRLRLRLRQAPRVRVRAQGCSYSSVKGLEE